VCVYFHNFESGLHVSRERDREEGRKSVCIRVTLASTAALSVCLGVGKLGRGGGEREATESV